MRATASQGLVVGRLGRLPTTLGRPVAGPSMGPYARLPSHGVNVDSRVSTTDLCPVNSVGVHAYGGHASTILARTTSTMQGRLAGREGGLSRPLDGAFRMLGRHAYEGMAGPTLLSTIAACRHAVLEAVP